MTVTLALAGDTMLGRSVARALATTPPQALVAPEVRDVLGQADLVVLNLECCISERGRPCTRSSPDVVVRPVSHLVSIGVRVPSGRGRLGCSGPVAGMGSIDRPPRGQGHEGMPHARYRQYPALSARAPPGRHLGGQRG